MFRFLSFIICVFFFSNSNLFAQAEEIVRSDSTSKTININLGYNYSSSHILDLGMSFRNFKTAGYHMAESHLAFSGEVVFGNKLIIGPKISGWIAGGSSAVAMGLSIINYTDFNQNEFNIRPEIGIGFFGMKAVYGYNIKVLGDGFDEISKSSFSFIFPIYSIKR
ncbi:MAG: hypothetical protein HUJ22_03430 [Gracilimonas sp.]|uniref:hypothetical protein n=1 Tax=Gracilimonas sp. TaxID=1974203 RepID=UPI00198F6D07|nr:hypothetical protein [Gracilimonas sp.]MBD3615600.1 hypothetical protein [Gracilimonas sp.]